MTGDERSPAPSRASRRARARRRARAPARRRRARRGAPRRVSTFDASGRVLAADVALADRRAAAKTTARWTATRCAPPTSPRAGTRAAGQPAHRRRARSARRSRPAPRRASSPARRCRPAPTRSSCRSSASAVDERRAHRRRAARRPVRSAAAARTCAPARRVLAAGVPPDAAGARPGGVGRRRRRCRSRARPRVALFSTGDELAMPGEPLKPGAIYNSNRFTLRGLIEALGCVCDDLGIVPDRLDATRDALRAGGRRQRPDRHLRRRLGRRGRPPAGRRCRPKGGSTCGRSRSSRASRWRSAQVLPRRRLLGAGSSACRAIRCRASSPSCSRVRPFLLRLQGASDVAPRGDRRCAPTSTGRRPDRRREFLRVRRNAAGGLDLFANQGSGVLTSTVWGDGLVDNPPGQAIRPATSCATCRCRSCWHEDHGALFRLACARRWAPGEDDRDRPRGVRRRATLRDALSRAAAAMRAGARAARPRRAHGAATSVARRDESAALARRRRSRLLPAGDRRLSVTRMAAARVSIRRRRLRPRRRGRRLARRRRRRRRGRRLHRHRARPQRRRRRQSRWSSSTIPGMTERAIEAMIDEAMRRFDDPGGARHPPRRPARAARRRSCWWPSRRRTAARRSRPASS